ncbi:hypothetical protein SAMN05216174_11140 [Actinokineospora iranica]|uniref:Uncharacterized protein n=2 Tax=Actinokineospora iranica TaxID=1271860 RepID=A0A1G6UQ15_9PSEU|nr:hypothetical protein SAMN05216174_11140 [Actinokineospora iranica]
MKDFNRIAVELAAVLLEYGGVIDAARKSLNNAMGKLVDAFHRKFYANENPLEKVLIKALVAISGAALTYVSGGTAAAAWAAGMTAVIDKTLDSGGPEIGGTTWRKLVDDYFVAQAEILRLVRAEIDRLNDDLTRLAGRLVDMPKLPG